MRRRLGYGRKPPTPEAIGMHPPVGVSAAFRRGYQDGMFEFNQCPYDWRAPRWMVREWQAGNDRYHADLAKIRLAPGVTK